MPSWTLGENIRQLREAKGLTAELLANRARVTLSFITILEGGQGSDNPSPAILQRIARVLGVTVSKLTGEP
ncbi:MAG: helix-turn-helix domain-containing protein [Terriglobales bacterium]